MSDFPRTGCSTGHRAPILRSPIPLGGFGRPLTSTERADLRAYGWRRVSERAIVVRDIRDNGLLGVVYYPIQNPAVHAYSSAGIYVQGV